MVDLSVIICAHNPRRDYLYRVLDALGNQTIPKDQWELLLIDNASAAPLNSTWDLSWHPHGRHIREDELGLGPARRCGMRASTADLLVFVDDDNVLSVDYLFNAVRIKREWPQLGVWGSGVIIPEFETSLPKHLEKWMGRRNNIHAYWSNVPSCAEALPWGSGLCVRRVVATKYCELYEQSAIQISDRRGDALWGGGDVEICFIACKHGLGMAVFPELRLTHLMSAKRCTEPYLLRLIESQTASSILLEYKWNKIVPRSPFSLRALGSLLVNLKTHRGFERRAQLAGWRGTVKGKHFIRQGSMLKGLPPKKIQHDCRSSARID